MPWYICKVTQLRYLMYKSATPFSSLNFLLFPIPTTSPSLSLTCQRRCCRRQKILPRLINRLPSGFDTRILKQGAKKLDPLGNYRQNSAVLNPRFAGICMHCQVGGRKYRFELYTTFYSIQIRLTVKLYDVTICGENVFWMWPNCLWWTPPPNSQYIIWHIRRTKRSEAVKKSSFVIDDLISRSPSTIELKLNAAAFKKCIS